MRWPGRVEAVLLLGCLALAGCGRFGDKPVEIAIAMETGNKEVMEGISRRYEESHPGTKVNIKTYTGGETAGYGRLLMADLDREDAPDLFIVAPKELFDVVAGGYALPLDDFVEREGKDFASRWVKSIAAALRTKGGLHAFPMSADAILLYYSKAVFDAAGVGYPSSDWTWDDLERAAGRLTKTGPDGRARIRGWTATEDILDYLIRSFGGAHLDDPDDPGLCVVDSPESARALEFWIGTARSGHLTDWPRDVHLGANAQTVFMTGKAGMIIGRSWFGALLADRAKDLDWDVVLPPKGPGGERGMELVAVGCGIHARTRHPKECWEFAKHLGDPAVQKSLVQGTGVPATEAVVAEWTESVPRLMGLKRGILGEMDRMAIRSRWDRWNGYYSAVWGETTKKLWRQRNPDVMTALGDIAATANLRYFAVTPEKLREHYRDNQGRAEFAEFRLLYAMDSAGYPFSTVADAAESFLAAYPKSAHRRAVEELRDWSRLQAPPATTEHIRSWQVVGPFGSGATSYSMSAHRYGPEKAIPRPTMTYVADGGGRLAFRRAEADGDGQLDLARAVGRRTGIAYALATVTSGTPQRAVLFVNSVEGAAIWLNGKKVHSKDGRNDMHAKPDAVKVTLKAGANVLLVKVGAASDEWTCRVGIRTVADLAKARGTKDGAQVDGDGR